MLRVGGKDKISILDLGEMISWFSDSPLGKECQILLEKYKDFNIKPRYVPRKVEFDEMTYAKYIGRSCLAKDLEYVFCS